MEQLTRVVLAVDSPEIVASRYSRGRSRSYV
jgi:hypothetical protein